MGRLRSIFTPNSGPPPAAELIAPHLSQLGTGVLFNGEYVILPGRAQTAGSVTVYGHRLQDPNSKAGAPAVSSTPSADQG